MKTKIHKEQTIVDDKFIWMSMNCNEMAPSFEIDGLAGLLQLDYWDESYIDFIKTNEIKAIELKGDRFETSEIGLSLLSSLPELRYLKISGKFLKKEYKVIEQLEQLEQLILADYEGYELDYSKMQKLHAFYSKINHIDHPIFQCHQLKYLGANTSLVEFTPFSVFTNLKEIYLFAKKLENLQGLDSLENLKILDIDYAHKLQLEDLRNLELASIEKLSLENCKNIKSLDFISCFPNLKCLWFDACGDIESLKPILECKRLEFILIGDSVITDGKMEYLQQLPSLKGIFFQNKKHYTLKKEDFQDHNELCNI